MPKSFASQFVKQRKHLNGHHAPSSPPSLLLPAPLLVLIISTKVTIWLYRKHLNLMCVDFASLAIFCIILHNPFVCGRLAKAAAAAAVAVASAAATCGVYVTCNFIAFACFIHSLPPLLTSFLSASYSSFPVPPPPFTLSLPPLFPSPCRYPA